MSSSYAITALGEINEAATRFDITTTSDPDEDQVEIYIAGREAELHRFLKAKGITFPLTAAADIAYVKPKIISVVVFDVYRDAFTYDDLPEGDKTRLAEWEKLLSYIAKGAVEFETDEPDGVDDFAFGIVRTVQRDDQWTDRRGLTDYDE